MSAKVLIVSVYAFLCFAISNVAPDCVPEPNDNFYWKTPCDGQDFNNSINVTNLKLSQNGFDVDSHGGIDLSVDIDVQIDFTNLHGPIQEPLFDAALRVHTHLLGKCRWIDIPTFGFASNLDPCKISSQCHVDKKESSVAVKLVAKQMARPVIGAVIVGDYYSVAITYKDGQVPVACAYIQDKVIKK